MEIFTYVVARDFGFAPNPFFGYCTLATCKPNIRKYASIGDWLIGTGAITRYNLPGRLIFAMKVEKVLDYDSYWNDPDFQCKKPIFNGSLKQLYGDNIYHQRDNSWIQDNSHHSLDSGEPNPLNVSHDTRVNRLLISQQFVYFGMDAPEFPAHLRNFNETGEDICFQGRNYRRLSTQLASAFENWLIERGEWGIQGLPIEFHRHSPIR